MKLDNIRNKALGIIVAVVAVLVLGSVFRFLSRTVVRVGGIAVLAALVFMAWKLIKQKAG